MNSHSAIGRLALAINHDLDQAVAYYEVYAPSGVCAPLIERVNQNQIHEGFNVVSEALELGVITTLCRIWDKTRGTARITEVMSRLLKNPSFVSDQTGFCPMASRCGEVRKIRAPHSFAGLSKCRSGPQE
jgi:hypothetical protein